MELRAATVRRLAWPACFLLASIVSSPSLFASNLGDTARQLAHKIVSATGPGAIALDITNRSSLEEKSVREVRGALEAELLAEGVRTAKPDQSMGSVQVTLSESLREYVWTAEIAVGSDEKRVALVSIPHPQPGGSAGPVMPLALRKTFLFAQSEPILDATLVEMGGGSRLLVLEEDNLTVYQQQGGRWNEEATLPIAHSRIFPRDPRGRMLLRHDHLLDIYLPGTFCRSNATMPLALACHDSDDPWPLTAEDNSVRAFFAPARNFFTGALSPGIGKISNAPSFYSVAALPRSSYTLWLLTAVDGSVHLLDGFTDQAIRGVRWGSDLAAIHSGCGTGTQVLVSDPGDPEHDSVRAFEIPDRDPVAASSAVGFDGRIVAVWPETSGATASAIVKRQDTGWYEANRISLACSN